LIDASLGVEGPLVQTSGHLVGIPSARGSAALDGDTSTAWIPGYFHDDPVLTVTTDEPTTITQLAPVLLDDDRFSVATEIALEVDGNVVGSYLIPGDGTAIDLPQPVTGTTFRFLVEDIEPRRTREWYGNVVVNVPVAIAELGVPELAVDVPAQLDTGCRADLLSIDGEPVPLRIHAPTSDLLDGQPVEAEVCDGPVDIAAGHHRLQTANGPQDGIDVDQVVLRSSGPAARRAAAAAAPRVTVSDDGRWQVGVDIEGATPGEPFWLVLGQSQSSGWQLDGEESTLVDGYANGWLVEPDAADLHLDLVWEPQRTVNRALLVSVVGVLACIGIALVGALRERRDPPADAAAAPRPPSPRPSTAWRVGVTATALVGTALIVGPVSALVVGAGTALAAWGPAGLRRWLWLAPVAGYTLAAGYVVSKQVWKAPGAAFEWPAEQAAAHQIALVTVAYTLVLVALQCRLDLPRANRTHRAPDEPLDAAAPS
jgi:arabinofuranan 3-O-arabinosyltransferase